MKFISSEIKFLIKFKTENIKLISCIGLLALLGFNKSSASPVTIGAFGDINGTECQTKYPSNSITAFNNLISNHKLDHIISTGDAVHGECLKYSGSTPYAKVVQGMWEEYNKNFFDLALKDVNQGLVLAPGNHDAPFVTATSRDTFKIENNEFQKFWSDNKSKLRVSPIEIDGQSGRYPYYWAYVYDKILFIVLQSTTVGSLSNGKEQKNWLNKLFNSDIAKEARAKIVFGHIPAYPVLDPSVGGKYSEIISKEQVGKSSEALMDLLLNNNVNLFVVGHSHAPYPAEITRTADNKKMKILSMPCTHAPRKLYGKSELANRGFAIITVTDDLNIFLNIKDWKTGQVIPYSYYPNEIPLKDKYVSYKKINEKFYK